jgi:addiction module HigA family antidote
MPRYKIVDRNPKFIAVVLSEQIQPGMFEFTLDQLVDHELELSVNALSVALGVPATRMHEIVKERRSVSADTAVRLACYFGGDDFQTEFSGARACHCVVRSSRLTFVAIAASMLGRSAAFKIQSPGGGGDHGTIDRAPFAGVSASVAGRAVPVFLSAASGAE